MLKNKLIIIPFMLPWDWSADYQKQTCLQLAKHNQVIAYMQKDAMFFLKRLLKRLSYPKIKNIFFYSPIYLLPFRRFAFIDKLNQIISFKLFEWLHTKRKNYILWIFDPDFYFYPKISKKSLSVYDCVDYHWGYSRKETKRIRENEKRLIQSVDIFIVNSKTLDKIHSKIKKPHLLAPQGFRIKDFTSKQKTSISFPQNKPVIGLIGAINQRIDFSLLFRLIKNNPQWHFVIWGPLQETEQKSAVKIRKWVTKLSSLSNVSRGESINGKEIPAIIEQFDIGIIPYDVTQDFNKYCYPMKLFEYFYMGKPVVSTPIEELKYFPKFVKIGRTAKEWERHIKTLLSNPWPEKYRRAQRKLAIANSWETKIEKISQILEKRYKI